MKGDPDWNRIIVFPGGPYGGYRLAAKKPVRK
jgi:hypothetical protein